MKILLRYKHFTYIISSDFISEHLNVNNGRTSGVYDSAQEEVRLPCINLNISSNILLQVQNGKAVL